MVIMADCNKKNTLVNLEYVLYYYYKLNKTHHPDVSAKGEHFARKEKALIWRTASKYIVKGMVSNVWYCHHDSMLLLQ